MPEANGGGSTLVVQGQIVALLTAQRGFSAITAPLLPLNPPDDPPSPPPRSGKDVSMTYLFILLGLAAAAVAALFALRWIQDRARVEAERRACGIVADAESRAQARLKEVELEAEERHAASEARFESQTRKTRD